MKQVDTYWIIEYHIPAARTGAEVEYWEAIVKETEIKLHLEYCPSCNKTKSFTEDGTCYTCGFQYTSMTGGRRGKRMVRRDQH